MTQKYNKKGKHTLVLILFLLLVLALPTFFNDSIAHKTAQQILAISMPSDTVTVETFSKAGKLVGNGNGMQYLGGVLIRSSLSLEELQLYYAQYAEHEWECQVEPQIGQSIRFVEHGRVVLETEIEDDKYFIVYSLGDAPSFFRDFDLRGH